MSQKIGSLVKKHLPVVRRQSLHLLLLGLSIQLVKINSNFENSTHSLILLKLDGTTNFIHGYPFVAVSIGLAINKIPTIGVVFNPLLNELYSAAKGKGAYLNQSRQLPLFNPPQPLIDLSHCLIATEAGSDRSKLVIDAKLAAIHDMLRKKDTDNPFAC